MNAAPTNAWRETPLQAADDRRRSRRHPMPGVFVTLGGPLSSRPMWAGNAVDICEDGLALAMTSEVEVGSDVLVSFELGGTSFERLPAVVLRQDPEYGVGALRFRTWPPRARKALVDHLRH
ncbi:MAG TPA: hypothetical protein VMT85_03975 [Thermoanaerobaculia bacterium]|nr:hypothetical protein [Thermoanaerobaculia bacterium]